MLNTFSCSYNISYFIHIYMFQDLVMVVKRRGGREWDKEMPHSEWINTVQLEPDVISMSFLPITSLLNGVPGCGFLNHAINLYLRCKFISHCSIQ